MSGIIKSFNSFTAALNSLSLKIDDLRANPSNSRSILRDEFSKASQASSELELWSQMLNKKERDDLEWIAIAGMNLLCESYQADDYAFYGTAEDRREHFKYNTPEPNIKPKKWDHLISEYEYQMILTLKYDIGHNKIWEELSDAVIQRVQPDPRDKLFTSTQSDGPQLKKDEYFSANADVIYMFTQIAQIRVAKMARKAL